MSNPTSNFGWQMPTATDLVTDLPADFEVFGQAVDTALMDLKGGTTNQVLAKNSNTDMDFKWVADAGFANPMTTTGDIIYSSSGSTPARLGIGTTGQVLNVAAGVPAWTTPAAGGGLTLLSTTTLAASEVNITSISQSYKYLQISVEDARPTSGAGPIQVRLNGSNDSHFGAYVYQIGANRNFTELNDNPMYLFRNTGTQTYSDTRKINATLTVFNYATSLLSKPFDLVGGFSDADNARSGVNGGGAYWSSSPITSVTIFNDNTMTGTVKIYGGN